jgi:hypothetical protein
MNILVPAIFLTVCGFYPAKNSGILNRVWNFRTSIPAGFFYAFNVLMLFIYAAAYDNTSVDIQFDKYLYRNLETPCTVYAINDSPYAPFGAGSIEYNFYKPAGLEVLYIESVDDNLAAMEGEGILVIADEKNDMLFSGNLSVKEIYHYEPRNIYSLLKAYVKKTKNFRWTLYRVTAK